MPRLASICQRCGKFRSGQKLRRYTVTGTHPLADKPLTLQATLHAACADLLAATDNVTSVKEAR